MPHFFLLFDETIFFKLVFPLFCVNKKESITKTFVKCRNVEKEETKGEGMSQAGEKHG